MSVCSLLTPHDKAPSRVVIEVPEALWDRIVDSLSDALYFSLLDEIENDPQVVRRTVQE